MKNSSIEKQVMGAAVILIVVLFVLFKIFDPRGKTVLLKDSRDENFDKRYLVQLRIDSFMSVLEQKYSDDIRFRMADRLSLELRNQGASTSDFYNDNTKLLDAKSYGFDIDKMDNSTIIANFDTMHVEGRVYVLVPSDVLYGVCAN